MEACVSRPREGHLGRPIGRLKALALIDPAFHLRAWLAQGERLADGHGADGRSRDALRAAIAGHVAETRCALGRRARANRNRLLDLMAHPRSPHRHTPDAGHPADPEGI